LQNNYPVIAMNVSEEAIQKYQTCNSELLRRYAPRNDALVLFHLVTARHEAVRK